VTYEPSPATLAALTGPVALELRAPLLDRMLGEAEGWPDRDTVALCREVLTRSDLARAARPPDVHVTVAGVPGHFMVQGRDSQLSWTPREDE
jgi:hypothetical protein